MRCCRVLPLCTAWCCPGYGRVLPKETIRLLATFQPPIPGVQYFDLCCRTLSGRVFKLEGKCDGLQPDVSLSHNVIMVCVFGCWGCEAIVPAGHT